MFCLDQSRCAFTQLSGGWLRFGDQHRRNEDAIWFLDDDVEGLPDIAL
jgi:hypothetical protein